MMQPIEELMAYYAFRTIKTRRIRRPPLSAVAKELAFEFENLVNDGATVKDLILHFESRFSTEELTKLYELFIRSEVDFEVGSEIDLAFEYKVEQFTRLEEREQLRKRFKELSVAYESEIDVNIDKTASEPVSNLYPEENLPTGEAEKGNILWQIVFLIIFLAVVAMLIRFVWLLIR